MCHTSVSTSIRKARVELQKWEWVLGTSEFIHFRGNEISSFRGRRRGRGGYPRLSVANQRWLWILERRHFTKRCCASC